MSTSELEDKQQENTDHIVDIRNAFQMFRDKEYKRFKDNITILLAIGGILWGAATWVGHVNNNSENLHNELYGLEKHLDERLKQQSDSIRDNNNENFDQLNSKIDEQNIKIQAINEKCDRWQFVTERWLNGRLLISSAKK